jgi:hypothetical protein
MSGAAVLQRRDVLSPPHPPTLVGLRGWVLGRRTAGGDGEGGRGGGAGLADARKVGRAASPGAYAAAAARCINLLRGNLSSRSGQGAGVAKQSVEWPGHPCPSSPGRVISRRRAHADKGSVFMRISMGKGSRRGRDKIISDLPGARTSHSACPSCHLGNGKFSSR